MKFYCPITQRFAVLVALLAISFTCTSALGQQIWENYGQASGQAIHQAGCLSCGSNTGGCSSCGTVMQGIPAAQGRPIASLFNRYCVRCHGVDGRGVCDYPDIPDFTNPDWQSSRTDEQLARLTHDGRGALMPAFRGTLTKSECAEMACYIRRFAAQPFAQQHVSNCQSCQSFQSSGGATAVQMLPQTTSRMAPVYESAPLDRPLILSPDQQLPTNPSFTKSSPAKPATITPSPTPMTPANPFDDFLSPTEITSPQTNQFLNSATNKSASSRKLPVVTGPADQLVIIRPNQPDPAYPTTTNSQRLRTPQPTVAREQSAPMPIIRTMPQESSMPNLQPPSASSTPTPIQSPLEPPTKETFMPFQLTAPDSGGNHQMTYSRLLPPVDKRPNLLPVYPETTKMRFRAFSPDYPQAER